MFLLLGWSNEKANGQRVVYPENRVVAFSFRCDDDRCCSRSKSQKLMVEKMLHNIVRIIRTSYIYGENDDGVVMRNDNCKKKMLSIVSSASFVFKKPMITRKRRVKQIMFLVLRKQSFLIISNQRTNRWRMHQFVSVKRIFFKPKRHGNFREGGKHQTFSSRVRLNRGEA